MRQQSIKSTLLTDNGLYRQSYHSPPNWVDSGPLLTETGRNICSRFWVYIYLHHFVRLACASIGNLRQFVHFSTCAPLLSFYNPGDILFCIMSQLKHYTSLNADEVLLGAVKFRHWMIFNKLTKGISLSLLYRRACLSQVHFPCNRSPRDTSERSALRRNSKN